MHTSFCRKWREEKAALLDKMDSEEKSEIQEWREQAKKELNDWYERRDEQLGKTQTSNRYVDASDSHSHRNLLFRATKGTTIGALKKTTETLIIVSTHNIV